MALPEKVENSIPCPISIQQSNWGETTITPPAAVKVATERILRSYSLVLTSRRYNVEAEKQDAPCKDTQTNAAISKHVSTGQAICLRRNWA